MLKDLILIGLDVSKGIVYCNGEEAYIEVLKVSCEDYENNIERACQLFEKQDWKNYTVVVHGIKSSMNSIGALDVSEMAKKLEFAGKEGRIDYILENHQNLIEEYKSIFEKITRCVYPQGLPNESFAANECLIEIDDSVFQQKLQEMESAMFELDGVKLLDIMSDLEGCRYKRTDLTPVIALAKRKVEMSDYFSAVDMIAELKN